MKNPRTVLRYAFCIFIFFRFMFLIYSTGFTDLVGEWVSPDQFGVLVVNDDGTGFRNLGSNNNEPFTWEYVEGRKIEINPYKTLDRMMVTYAQADPLTGVLKIYKTPDLDPKKITTVYTRRFATRNALLP